MRVIEVELGGGRNYPIYIGSGLLRRAELFRPHISGSQVMVVSNQTVAPLYLDAVLEALQGWEVHSKILPDGEEFKTLTVADSVFSALLEVPCDRLTTVVALGGGVIGDLAGFVAACYQRGVPYIQVPTTLLSQVDSSVGGKTAVNHPLGKNMIGAFYQPRGVIADTDTLRTLPDRELVAGLGEVVKYGLIGDPDLFAWLEDHVEALLERDADALDHVIERCCRNKADVVAQDERESGVRALLNLGHTFGHAIETGLGYGVWLHGEAVAAGMVLAAELSRRLGWLAVDDVQRIRRLLERAGLPVRRPRELGAERLLELMAVDKKALGRRVRLVCLKRIGEAVLVADYPVDKVLETLRAPELVAAQ